MSDYTPQQLQAYKALQIAAERMGHNNYQALCIERKGRRTIRYVPTEAHKDVMMAMAQVLSGMITPDEAMTLLRRADVEKERLGK